MFTLVNAAPIIEPSTKGNKMKPIININWKQKAKRLERNIGIREAAYQCGIAEYTYKRIMSGHTKTVSYDCGTLMLWLLKDESK